MPHTQITLDCAQSQVPRVEALLEALGALAITLSEPDDEEILEPGPGEQRLWSHLRLTALFDAATVDPLRLQARVAEVLGAPQGLAGGAARGPGLGTGLDGRFSSHALR